MQDDAEAMVWESWEATWRDVWILDQDNEPVTVFNLTEHNLSDPDEYAALKTLLVEAAGGTVEER